MISVLIPVHNYRIYDLVTELHRQLMHEKIPFEILIMEDGSDDDYIEENKRIESFSNVSCLVTKQQSGSLKTRLLLAEEAKYDWLLFVDADTIPKTQSFIRNYINATNLDSEIILGGIAYYQEKPNKNFVLRWKYGSKYEQVKADTRNKLPYKNIVCANMLIKRTVFSKLNLEVNSNSYGFDNLFASQLKNCHAKVLHIDNEVYHLGLENSSIYLKKKESAAQSLLYLFNNNLIANHDISLLKLFVFLKKTRLNYAVSFFFKMSRNTFRSNLIGSHPSLILLQMYRIGYLCYIDKNDKDKIK